MKKVSFDFDSTLDRQDVQQFVIQLMDQGFEPWICTSRLTNEKAKNQHWNDDLFEVANKLQIPQERIIFTNYNLKCDFLRNRNFIFHLDDDDVELRAINSTTNVKGIMVFKNPTWKQECLESLK